jgi:hypothetical protein
MPHPAIRAFTSVWVSSRVIREIEIRWPSGTRQMLHDVTADRVMVVTEPGAGDQR